MPPMLSLLPPGRQEPQKGLLDGVLFERAANNGNFISPAITPARVQLRARRIGGESGIVHYVRTVASKHMPSIKHGQASSPSPILISGFAVVRLPATALAGGFGPEPPGLFRRAFMFQPSICDKEPDR